MDEQEIKVKVMEAAKMADLLAGVPEGQRDLVRLALTFYTSGISAGLALCMPSAQQAN